MLNITKLPQWGDTIRWGRLRVKRRRSKGSMQYTPLRKIANSKNSEKKN
jgi:hypothetical protein